MGWLSGNPRALTKVYGQRSSAVGWGVGGAQKRVPPDHNIRTPGDEGEDWNCECVIQCSKLGGSLLEHSRTCDWIGTAAWSLKKTTTHRGRRLPYPTNQAVFNQADYPSFRHNERPIHSLIHFFHIAGAVYRIFERIERQNRAIRRSKSNHSPHPTSPTTCPTLT